MSSPERFWLCPKSDLELLQENSWCLCRDIGSLKISPHSPHGIVVSPSETTKQKCATLYMYLARIKSLIVRKNFLIILVKMQVHSLNERIQRIQTSVNIAFFS